MALQNVKKILVVELGGIGDLLIALPALAALRRAYPAAACDALVVDRARTLAGASGVFDAVLSLGGGPVAALLALWRARRGRYDLVINMRPIARAAAAVKIRSLFSCIGGKVWAGRNTDGRGRFFRISIPEPLRALKHDREYARELMEALGASVTDMTIRVPFAEEDVRSVARLLRERGIPDGACLIGLHVGGMPSHRWPGERFQAVMKKLAGQYRCFFVLTGNGQERAYAARIAGLSGVQACNVAGQLSFGELAALIRRCALYIANDTGPVHIAAALGVPLIAIFGPGDFTRFDPRVISPAAVALYRPSSCAPCDRPRCAHQTCLSGIMPQEVLEHAVRMLDTAGAATIP